MPIHLNPDDDARREARLSTVDEEKANAAAIKVGAASMKEAELQKDNLNITYQNYFGGIVQSYEDEKKSIDGFSLLLLPSTPWNFSVLNGVVEAAGIMTGVLHLNNQAQPLRVPEFNPVHLIGEYAPFSTVAGAVGTYEVYGDTYETEALQYLKNGFSDGAFSQTLNSILLPGGTFPDLTATTGLAVNDRIVMNDGSTGHSAIARVKVLLPFEVEYILGSGTNFQSAFSLSIGTIVTKTLPAFTNADRTSMTSTNYQEILINARLNWWSYITYVENQIIAQMAIFDANQHDRKDMTYRLSLTNRLAQLQAYLPPGLVTDTDLTNIQNNTLVPRASERSARVAAILAALTPLYDKRYGFTNLRANTIQGSYALYKTYSRGVAAAQGMVDFATAASTAYET